MKRFKKIFCIFLLILLLCGCSQTNKSYFGEIPYSAEFGMSYKDLVACDKDALEPEANKNGDSMISAHRDIDGSFLGYPADDLSITLMYSFGMDNSLSYVGEHITINDGASTTADELFAALSDSFTERYGEHEPALFASYTWRTLDGMEIRLVKFDDTLISIIFEQD